MNEWGDILDFDETTAPKELDSTPLGEALGGIFVALLTNGRAESADPGARRMDYRTEYLASERWKETRQRAIIAHGNVCLDCGERGSRYYSLDVHHLTYERLGNEPVTDLVVLCRTCHRVRHGKTGDE
jgi:predicted HNH restriction endonuclease